MASATARPPRKSTCMILDAMAVIESHGLGIWDNLLDKIDAIIPSTVVKDEVFYFDTKKTGKRGPIKINQAISSGKVAEIPATGRKILTSPPHTISDHLRDGLAMQSLPTRSGQASDTKSTTVPAVDDNGILVLMTSTVDRVQVEVTSRQRRASPPGGARHPITSRLP
jgi:hypothetical protein